MPFEDLSLHAKDQESNIRTWDAVSDAEEDPSKSRIAENEYCRHGS